MLVVTVDIWPFGKESEKRTLGELRIANVTAPGAPDYKEMGDYEVQFSDETKSHRVHGHPRADGFWPLIHAAIENRGK